MMQFWAQIRNVIRSPYSLLNTFALAPDRFLAIFGVIFAIVFGSLVFFGNIDAYASEHPFRIAAGYLLLLLFFFIVSIAASYLLARTDPDLFADVISQKISTDKVIRTLADECLMLMASIGKQTGYQIFGALSKNRNRLSIIEKTKLLIAARLELNPTVFCDQILMFSPGIYRSRQIKRAFNSLPSFEDATEKRIENGKISQFEVKCTMRLRAISNSSLNFTQIGYMFRAKSTLLQMQHLVTILESVQGKAEETRLFFQIQKALNDGITLSRLIALTIIGTRYRYIAEDGSQQTIHPKALWEAQLRYLCLDPSTDLKPEHFKNWSRQIYDLLKYLYEDISKKVQAEISGMNKHFARKVLVVKNYSRVTRSVLRRLFVSGCLKEFEIFILIENDRDKDFGSRLMRHQLEHEHYITDDEMQAGKGEYTTFSSKLRMVTLDELSKRVGSLRQPTQEGSEQSRLRPLALVYLTGCEGVVRERVVATREDPELRASLKSISEQYDDANFEVFALSSPHKKLLSDFELDPENERMLLDVAEYLPSGGWDNYHIWESVNVFTNEEDRTGDGDRPGNKLSEPTPIR